MFLTLSTYTWCINMQLYQFSDSKFEWIPNDTAVRIGCNLCIIAAKKKEHFEIEIRANSAYWMKLHVNISENLSFSVHPKFLFVSFLEKLVDIYNIAKAHAKYTNAKDRMDVSAYPVFSQEVYWIACHTLN